MKFSHQVSVFLAVTGFGMMTTLPSHAQASLKPIPSSLRGTWKGTYSGVPFTLKVNKYTIFQNGQKYQLTATPHPSSFTDFTMSSHPNKKGYWKFTLSNSNDPQYVKRTTKDGKQALIRYSYDESKKPVVQYLYR